MTQRQLTNRVYSWAGKLGYLGLSHWRFYVEIADEEPGDDFVPTMNAAVSASTRYDHAFLKFRRGFLEDEDFTERSLDEAIIHELLHVAHRDYEEAIHSVDNRLAPGEREVWDARLEHEYEGVIERLARTIAELVH